MQIYLGYDLDHLGSRDIIGHVTIWYPRCHSRRCSIIIESISRAVFEVMGTKHIGVTTLTFPGHLTSTRPERTGLPGVELNQCTKQFN